MGKLSEKNSEAAIARGRLIKVARTAGLTEREIALGLKTTTGDLPPDLSSGRRNGYNDTAYFADDKVKAAVAERIANVEAIFLEELEKAGWDMKGFTLHEKSRAHIVSRPRFVCIWLIRNIIGANASFPMIAKHFGFADHTTCLHAVSPDGAVKVMREEELLATAAERTRWRYYKVI